MTSETLASHVKGWRQRAGLTQVTAAEQLQMSVATLRNIEQGRPFKFAPLLLLAIEALEARGHGR